MNKCSKVGSSWISSGADIPELQATNGNVFSIYNAEYTAVRRKAGLGSDMDIYEIIMFIRINTEQHRNQLKVVDPCRTTHAVNTVPLLKMMALKCFITSPAVAVSISGYVCYTSWRCYLWWCFIYLLV